MQQNRRPEEFSDGAHRRLAELYWSYQRDEGEPTLAEFVSLLDDQLKELAINAVDEVEALEDLDRTLAEAMRFFEEQRKRSETAKLIAELRRTSDPKMGNPQPGDEKAQVTEEIDLLRKLQEQARRPDMRRTGS